MFLQSKVETDDLTISSTKKMYGRDGRHDPRHIRDLSAYMTSCAFIIYAWVQRNK